MDILIKCDNVSNCYITKLNIKSNILPKSNLLTISQVEYFVDITLQYKFKYNWLKSLSKYFIVYLKLLSLKKSNSVQQRFCASLAAAAGPAEFPPAALHRFHGHGCRSAGARLQGVASDPGLRVFRLSHVDGERRHGQPVGRHAGWPRAFHGRQPE